MLTNLPLIVATLITLLVVIRDIYADYNMGAEYRRNTLKQKQLRMRATVELARYTRETKVYGELYSMDNSMDIDTRRLLEVGRKIDLDVVKTVHQQIEEVYSMPRIMEECKLISHIIAHIISVCSLVQSQIEKKFIVKLGGDKDGESAQII